MARGGKLMPVEPRLWARVDKCGPLPEHRPDLGPCWIWTGCTNSKGYAHMCVEGSKRYVHRLVYQLVVGTIPPGLTIDHLCRNRRCVNPSHLEPVTGRENTLRGESRSAQHARKTHCPRSHPYDLLNTRYGANGRRYCRTCESTSYAERKRSA